MPTFWKFRCLARRARRGFVASLIASAATIAPSMASGQTPFLDPRVGGLGLIGPATSHPASVFYNPATMALKSGHRIYLEGAALLAAARQQPALVDRQTGEPTSPWQLDSQQTPSAWSPRFFFTAQSNLGLEGVMLGISVATPATMVYSHLRGPSGDFLDPSLQAPGRAHGTDLTLYHLYLTPSAALEVTEQFLVGLSFSFIFGSLDYGFVRDAALDGGRSLDRDSGGQLENEHAALDDCGSGDPCGYGSSLAAEGVRVNGNSSGVALSAGVLVKPHRDVDIGLAVVTGVVIGLGGRAAEGDAFITRAEATYTNAEADPSITSPRRQLRGRGTIDYALPHLVNLGASWRVTTPLTLDLQLRWIDQSLHDRLDIRLTGAELRDAPAIPDHIVHYRGLIDTFSVQLGASYGLTPRIRLEGAAMIESPAVSEAALSPLMIDGWKLDGLVALQLSLGRHFNLRVGYGLRWVPPRDVRQSGFSPAHLVECVDRYFDVDLPACQAAEEGRGLASAAGRYSLALHRFSLALGVDL